MNLVHYLAYSKLTPKAVPGSRNSDMKRALWMPQRRKEPPSFFLLLWLIWLLLVMKVKKSKCYKVTFKVIYCLQYECIPQSLTVVLLSIGWRFLCVSYVWHFFFSLIILCYFTQYCFCQKYRANYFKPVIVGRHIISVMS